MADYDISFRGLSLVQPYYVDVSVTGLFGSPEVRASDIPRSGKHGMIVSPDYWAGRTITLETTIIAYTQAEFNSAVQAFANAFRVGGEFNSGGFGGFTGQEEYPFTFTIPGLAGSVESYVYCRARRYSGEISQEYSFYTCRAVVELFASDPRIYNSAASQIVLTPDTGGGGFTFPLTFPLVFAAGSTGGTITITNDGNTPMQPLVTVTGPLTNPVLFNQTSDKIVAASIVLGASDSLTFDMGRSLVILNGSENRYSSLTSAEFWGIEPGANTIKFTTAASSPGAQAVFALKNAYI